MLNISSYVSAGSANFTLVSRASGNRFTFKAKRLKAERKAKTGPVFISVLTGPQNTSDYTYLGTLFPDGTYRHGRKSPIGADAPSAKAFAWFADKMSADALPASVEFVPSGKCCACGRTLTTPESVAAGIGPECGSRLG